MLRNLTGNALTYTTKGRVLVTVRRRGATALIQVWDTGIGIPADQFELIFRELHQVGNSARDRTQGLGLGLAIVKRLADAMGFAVTVRSKLGRGSVFSFSVPLAPAPAPVAHVVDEATPAVRAAPGSVALIIDDDVLVRSALGSMLGVWGYEVVAANGAEEASQYLVELERVDLVVSDLWLPGADGLDLLRSLAPSRPLQRVLISGDTDPRTPERARAEGVTFLRKPVRAAQLREALTLDLSRSLRSGESAG